MRRIETTPNEQLDKRTQDMNYITGNAHISLIHLLSTVI